MDAKRRGKERSCGEKGVKREKKERKTKVKCCIIGIFLRETFIKSVRGCEAGL